MLVDITLSDKDCRYQQCKYNNNGECTNIKARLDCLVTSLAVLGIGESEVEESEVIPDKS